MNKEEQQLEEMRMQLELQPIPEQRLDEAILAGFHNARTKRNKLKRSIWLSFTAAVLLIGFVTTVRVSPAFANAVSSIPGLSTIVDMIQRDKGIKDIVENEYFEELNITAIEDDITVTLLGVIADESGMIISYKVEAPFDIQHLDTKNLNVYQNGKELEAAYSYNWYPNEPTKIFEDQVEITAAKPLNFDKSDFELEMVIDNDVTVDVSSSSFTNDDNFLSFEPTYRTQDAANPVKVYIHAYPNYLDGSAVVQIK